jgi:antitoxin FitA
MHQHRQRQADGTFALRSRGIAGGGSKNGRNEHSKLNLICNRFTTIMVVKKGEVMPATLTLKNLPDEVYARLKASAESHRRSLNSEAIVCLESVLLPERFDANEHLARARALRATLPKGNFSTRQIDALKRTGRA